MDQWNHGGDTECCLPLSGRLLCVCCGEKANYTTSSFKCARQNESRRPCRQMQRQSGSQLPKKVWCVCVAKAKAKREKGACGVVVERERRGVVEGWQER